MLTQTVIIKLWLHKLEQYNNGYLNYNNIENLNYKKFNNYYLVFKNIMMTMVEIQQYNLCDMKYNNRCLSKFIIIMTQKLKEIGIKKLISYYK